MEQTNGSDQIPRLFGLILSGGKSSRMGRDKGVINYHGKPHREHLYDLASEVCEQVFLSIRSDQEESIPKGFSIIKDRNEFKGPFNGLLSAHELHPKAAWLILACDLPMIDREALKQLVQGRDATKMATAFATRESGLPEPLIAIWEPKGLDAAIQYLKEGTSTCPRKFLINNETHLINPVSDTVLYNANSEEEFKEILKILDIK